MNLNEEYEDSHNDNNNQEGEGSPPPEPSVELSTDESPGNLQEAEEPLQSPAEGSPRPKRSRGVRKEFGRLTLINRGVDAQYYASGYEAVTVRDLTSIIEYNFLKESAPLKPNPDAIRYHDEYSNVNSSCLLLSLDSEDVSCPIRVTLVDESYAIKFDRLVRHPSRGTMEQENEKFKGRFSDITPIKLSEAVSLEIALQQLASIISPDSVLIAHNAASDLVALQISHPFIVDSQTFYNHSNNRVSFHGLGELAHQYVPGDTPDHNPINDARVTMKIIQKKLQNGLLFGNLFLEHVASDRGVRSKGDATVICNSQRYERYSATRQRLSPTKAKLTNTHFWMTQSIDESLYASIDSLISSTLTVTDIQSMNGGIINEFVRILWNIAVENTAFFVLSTTEPEIDRATLGIAYVAIKPPQRKRCLQESDVTRTKYDRKSQGETASVRIQSAPARSQQTTTMEQPDTAEVLPRTTSEQPATAKAKAKSVVDKAKDILGKCSLQ